MGIRGDSAQLEEGETGGLDFRDHPVVEAALLDGTAPVGQQNAFAEAGKLRPLVGELVLPEIDLRGNLINEVIHPVLSFDLPPVGQYLRWGALGLSRPGSVVAEEEPCGSKVPKVVPPSGSIDDEDVLAIEAPPYRT